MSGGTVCACEERQVPEVRERAWRLTAFRSNHSAFNGGRYTPSAYSAVICLRCGATWRTTAAYVTQVPMLSDLEQQQCLPP